MRRYSNAKLALLGCASLFVAVAMLVSPATTAAVGKCYSKNSSGKVENLPTCDRTSLEQAGFKMDGLPTPLDPTVCYLWGNDATLPGQPVPCGDPSLEGAGQIDDNPAPTASLGNIPDAANGTPVNFGLQAGKSSHPCGAGKEAVTISIDIGCVGKGNPILDALFAAIRFLSLGVGMVVVGSIIVAGIQYTVSRGDPQATAKSVERITNSLIALVLFIFTYALLNWLVPAGLLK